MKRQPLRPDVRRAAWARGGSIRVPAHFCGICGLKPTPGRIPATGHFPAGVGAFSWIGVVGPMAGTIADVRALFEVMAGPDPGDALSAPVPLRTVNDAQLKSLRVGVLESDALGKVDAETHAALQKAANDLAAQGFVVEPQVIGRPMRRSLSSRLPSASRTGVDHGQHRIFRT